MKDMPAHVKMCGAKPLAQSSPTILCPYGCGGRIKVDVNSSSHCVALEEHLRSCPRDPRKSVSVACSVCDIKFLVEDMPSHVESHWRPRKAFQAQLRLGQPGALSLDEICSAAGLLFMTRPYHVPFDAPDMNRIFNSVKNVQLHLLSFDGCRDFELALELLIWCGNFTIKQRETLRARLSAATNRRAELSPSRQNQDEDQDQYDDYY
jgi:hypothetical protein